MLTFSNDAHIAEQQFRAIIYYLVALGYIDADFHPDEKGYIRAMVRRLVERRAAQQGGDPATRQAAIELWSAHFHNVLDEFDHEILLFLAESVIGDESAEHQAAARIKLHCLERFSRFDPATQDAMLATADELIRCDGQVHPAEEAFQRQMAELLHAPVELTEADLEPLRPGEVVVSDPGERAVVATDHPFFRGLEWDYGDDPADLRRGWELDLELIRRVRADLKRRREQGKGRLEGMQKFSDFNGLEPFLDGYVHVLPPEPNTDYDLLVLGDLHGCYSCLKAALMQWDFWGRMAAFREDPLHSPIPALVFLGDYIDRGRFNFAGTLRAVMKLGLSYPGHVYMLRGNHEYYLDLDGKVVAPVRPCEAHDSVVGPDANEFLFKYRELFDDLPCMLAFGKTLFVHGGIPRQQTLRSQFVDLSSLNNWDLRFEMLWSDPAETDVVPDALQQDTARFAFGQRQLRHFLARLDLSTLIRGHELENAGFRLVHDDSGMKLATLFSAGGLNNGDLLRKKTGYRKVIPHALSVHHHQGSTTFSPFRIRYEEFNSSETNGFYR